MTPINFICYIVEAARTHNSIDLYYADYDPSRGETNAYSEEFDIYNEGPYSFLDSCVEYYDRGHINLSEGETNEGTFRICMFRTADDIAEVRSTARIHSDIVDCPRCPCTVFEKIWIDPKDGYITFTCVECGTIFNVHVEEDVGEDGFVTCGVVSDEEDDSDD